MAIFGMNGLWGTSLYLVTLFALYGMKNSGYENAAAIESHFNIALRKGLKGTTDPAARKRAIEQARTERVRGIEQAKGKAKREYDVPAGYAKTDWAR